MLISVFSMTVSILAARLTGSVYNVIVRLERDAARQNKSVLKTTSELNIPLTVKYVQDSSFLLSSPPPLHQYHGCLLPSLLSYSGWDREFDSDLSISGEKIV